MKIRTGFVSNSSSTSFIICGWNLEVNAWETNKDFWNLLGMNELDWCDAWWDNIKKIESRLPKGSRIVRGDEEIYIGVGITGGEGGSSFNEETAAKIPSWKNQAVELFPGMSKPTYMYGECYDG